MFKKVAILLAALLVLPVVFTACSFYGGDMSEYVSVDELKGEITVGREPLVDDKMIKQQIGTNVADIWTYSTASTAKKPSAGTSTDATASASASASETGTNSATANEADKLYKKDEAIKLHDLVYFYYYGVTKSDGNAFEGGTYMDGKTTPYGLMIGSGLFIDGFEDGLIGKIPSDTSRESATANSTLKADSVVYLTIKTTYEVPKTTESATDTSAKEDATATPELESGTAEAATESATTESTGSSSSSSATTTKTYTPYTASTAIRVDLADKDDPIANLIREKATTEGTKITDFTIEGIEITVDGKTYNNAKAQVKVSYIVKDFAIDVTFPEDYGNEDLQGEEATFYIVVDGLMTFEDMATKLGDNNDALVAAEGKTLYETYYEKVNVQLDEQYAKNIVNNRYNAIWSYLMDTATFKNIPKDQVESTYDELYYNYKDAYDAYANLYQQIAGYDTFAKYMQVTLGSNWKDQLRKESENHVKERILIYHLVDKLGIKISDSEVEKLCKDKGYDYDEYEEDAWEALAWDKIVKKLDDATNYFKVVEAEEETTDKADSTTPTSDASASEATSAEPTLEPTSDASGTEELPSEQPSASTAA